MSTAKLDQLSEPGILSRMGGAANGGSSKTPQERRQLDEEHQGKDLDEPAASDPGSSGPGSSGGSQGSENPQPSRDRRD